jgi:hypothetical protein
MMEFLLLMAVIAALWICADVLVARTTAGTPVIVLLWRGLSCEPQSEWFMHGWHAALERAARRLETANDETSRQCIAQAIRDLIP